MGQIIASNLGPTYKYLLYNELLRFVLYQLLIYYFDFQKDTAAADTDF